MLRIPRVSARFSWISYAVPLALLIAGVLLAVPRLGVQEMAASQVGPGVRAVERRLRAVESALELQARTIEELRAENERLRAAQAPVASPTPTDDAAAGIAVRLFPVPERVEFLGEVLPLDRPEVHQRFEEEWTRLQVNRHWLVKWHRRTRDVFPLVEQKLAAAQMPDDLKYVLVIESGVDARAISSAGAEGWWQFMPGTGKDYGLQSSSYVDDRRDLERSTDAAIRHFRDLHATLGSWPLALSAYNAGERRVRQLLEEQGETSFYDAVLPTETEAYWFKAAAAKIILGSPERFQLPLSDDGWAQVACDTLDIRVLVGRFELRSLTASSDLTYREIKALNPALKRSYLPVGTYRLVVPARHGDAVIAALDGAQLLRRATGVEPPLLARGEVGDADGSATEPIEASVEQAP